MPQMLATSFVAETYLSVRTVPEVVLGVILAAPGHDSRTGQRLKVEQYEIREAASVLGLHHPAHQLPGKSQNLAGFSSRSLIDSFREHEACQVSKSFPSNGGWLEEAFLHRNGACSGRVSG